MTKEQWLSLKVGDVIVEMKSGTERKVLSVSRHEYFDHIRTSITLKKIAHGWTFNQNTVYNNSSDGGRWRIK